MKIIATILLAFVAVSIGLSIGPRPADAVRMQSTTDYQIELSARSRI